MSDEFDAVVERVRERVSPDADEQRRLQRVADEVMGRARTAVDDLPVEATVIQVGSTARGTWTAGDRDIDVFVSFPPELDRETLEQYGLEVGHAVLPEGLEEYAEHPYVVGEREGYDIDLVPCYAVESASEIQSAVDRTPFHTRYLESHLDDEDLAGAVRVTKQFLKGIGVYGSDLRTRGFSGYLTELLIVEYGSFREFVEAAADWQIPIRFDPEDHGEKSFDDPIVMIDPTDPERNVAAVCSPANVARLQHYARDLLANPRVELFETSDPAPYDDSDVEAAIDARGTTPIALRFDAPDIVDDQLWPQLRKSLAGLTDALDRQGFDVVRASTFVDDDGADSTTDSSSATAVLFVELAVTERPQIERHDGPPVDARQHATGFYEKYADDPAVAGPYIDGDRYVVERPREFTTAIEYLSTEALFDVRLGTHVEAALESGYDVLVGTEITALTAPFGVDLVRYFEPKP